jgi:hypothetical protein
MATLAAFARYETATIICAITAIVLYQFLAGQINTRGLLSEKTSAGVGAISPARVQLLLFTLAFAIYLLSEIVKTYRFPEIDIKWLVLLAGSHSVFLGAKGVLSLLGSSSPNLTPGGE